MTATLSETILNPILHQPIRTRIVAFLIARGEATFTDLKIALDITDGNLEAHMKKLKASEYITTCKQRGQGRPQTLYSVSKEGRTAFDEYVESLQKLLTMEFKE
ncbi:MAG: transcriptional regulator [Thiohalomonadales bacterium]